MAKTQNDPIYVYTSAESFSRTVPFSAERRDRIIARDATITQAGGTSASFTLLNKDRRSIEGVFADTYEPSVNQFIMISTASAIGDVEKENILFSGIIQTINDSPLQLRADSQGSISANGIEELLRQRQVTQGLMWDDKFSFEGETGATRPITSLPPFNFPRKAGSDTNAVVGNAYPIAAESNDYVFANDLTLDEVTKWSRIRIINYLAKYAWPEEWPEIDVQFDSDGIDPLSVDETQTFDLNYRTFLEAFDLLIHEAVGYKYSFTYDYRSNKFILRIFPVSEELVDAEGLTIQGCSRDVEFSRTFEPQYDRIHLIGDRIIGCGTFYARNQTEGVTRPGQSLTPGWDDSVATKLIRTTGMPESVIDESGVDEWRKGSEFDPVFKRYILYQSDTGILCKTGESFFATQRLPIQLTWTGTYYEITEPDETPTVNLQPNYPALRIMNQIPWYRGVAADGTDNRSDEQKQNPELIPIQVWRVVYDGVTYKMFNLRNPTDTEWDVPTVEPLQTAAGIDIDYGVKEVLAQPYFNPSSDLYDSEYQSGLYDPMDVTNYEAGDFRDICFTAAVKLDQHLEVIEDRVGVTNPTRVLYLYKPEYQFWYVRKYTVINSLQGQQQNVGEYDVVTRNNYPQAQELVNKIKNFAFRSRTEASFTYGGFSVPSQFYSDGTTDNPDYEVLGQVVTSFEDLDREGSVIASYPINTIVESLTYNFDPDGPSISISTRKLVSNYSGVSSALGGNVFNAIQDLKAEQQAINDKVYDKIQSRFVGGGGGGGTDLILGKILGGNAVSTSAVGDTYPDSKPQAIAMDLFNSDGTLLTLPSLTSWSDVELGLDYTPQSVLPLLPNGLCYVKLERPFEFGSKSWAADIVAPLSSSESSELEVTRVITDTGEYDKINVFLNHPIELLAGTGLTSFVLTINSTNGSQTNGIISSIAINEDSNAIILTLQNALDPETQTATLAFGQVCKKQTEGETPILNNSYNGTVIYSNYSSTIMICLNGNSTQIFQEGALVLIDKSTVSIEDSSGETRSVPQVLGPASAAQIHDHSDYTKSGLGKAFLSLGDNL